MALVDAGRPDTSRGGPERLALDAGEQYRFRFEMDACIGCHSCEVACAEQNSNPVGVNWRRVGELEGGTFPDARRFNLSMACNHCLEPTCLSGCPTNAYVKLSNGIVAHHAEDCIGCQYCIWNCPYEVPVFNRQRRIVTKCDLCQPRLAAGSSPACVEACPTHAISVEKVNIAAWRADHHDADAPGLPPADITLSTTNIVLPAAMPAGTRSVVEDRVAPAEPHWPLVAVTLLTQLCLGALAATVILNVLAVHHAGAERPDVARGAAVAALASVVAIGVSLLHLGRPAAAWKALRNLRRSWLSREVLLFGALAGASCAYAVALAARGQSSFGALALGVVAVVTGVAGIYASGRLYMLPARPVWHSPRSIVMFYASALATGPLLVTLAAAPSGDGRRALFLLGAAGALLQLGAVGHLVAAIRSGRGREFTLTGRLLLGRFRVLFAFRVAALVLALGGCAWGAVEPAGRQGAPLTVALLVVAAAGETAGRYLFFVTVTPMTAGRRFSAVG
ncbi:MAG TPA: DmsC/YnfH family molybdoenzyme membrane anchor subunit [Acidimicrobiales bacterium]|jgi:DMSO reductase iron-sulfur subunit|nr:DmsC/YnfH family molybdoenzyme membrane anchor subunit [Acidimicrobiales bacterium]